VLIGAKCAANNRPLFSHGETVDGLHHEGKTLIFCVCRPQSRLDLLNCSHVGNHVIVSAALSNAVPTVLPTSPVGVRSRAPFSARGLNSVYTTPICFLLAPFLVLFSLYH
jgi:hypothetical protein